MKRLSLLLAGAALFALLAGCNTSVITVRPPFEGQKSASGREVVGNLEADNWGLYLFYYIPIWCGNYNRPNKRDYEPFAHYIRDKYIDMMLSKRAKLLKAEAEEVEISESSSGFFSLWIIWRRSNHGTAVAVKSGKSGGDARNSPGLFAPKD